MIVWLLCFHSCKPITRARMCFHMPVVWFAASFFGLLFFPTHPRGSSREGWSACQQGAGKRLVFNLIRANSIAWNCGREARSFVRSFVLALNFSTDRKVPSLSVRLLLFSLFFLQGRFASRSTSACTTGSRSIRIGIALDRNSIKKCSTPPFRPKFPIFGTIFLRTYGRTIAPQALCSQINLYSAKYRASIENDRLNGLFMDAADLRLFELIWFKTVFSVLLMREFPVSKIYTPIWFFVYVTYSA